MVLLGIRLLQCMLLLVFVQRRYLCRDILHLFPPWPKDQVAGKDRRGVEEIQLKLDQIINGRNFLIRIINCYYNATVPASLG